MKKCGYSSMVFKREWFFLHLFSRHYGKLFNYNKKLIRLARGLLLAIKWFDSELSDTKWMKRNQLVLVWGFDR